ncbi:MAG: sugar-binding domain-containing protein, partial [Planctomycetota bacterium]
MRREVRKLKRGWRFMKGDPEGAARGDFDDSSWREVRVPHDWAIEGPFDRENDVIIKKIVRDGKTVERVRTGCSGGLPHPGVAWYRLRLDLPEDLPDAMGERRVRVEFDGVMSRSEVFLNGRPAGAWPYGYASFAFDVTELARAGANVLAVRVDNKPLASRWYPGAGIYRNVRLVVTGPVHVSHWGTYVTTPEVDVDARTAKVRVRTEVENHAAGPRTVEIETTIIDPDGKAVASVATSKELETTGVFEQELDVKDVRLWAPDTPELYRAMTVVRAGGETVDECETAFGIREMRFDASKGFFINGRALKCKGVCLHHDLGPLGTAV